jgi:hypothetical protein
MVWKMRLCGTAVSKGLMVRPPDDIWVSMEQRWNDTDREKQKNWERNLSHATFSTSNPTRTALTAKLGLCGESMATYCF